MNCRICLLLLTLSAALLLAACGGSALPEQVIPDPGSRLQESMPLPNSEKTRVAVADAESGSEEPAAASATATYTTIPPTPEPTHTPTPAIPTAAAEEPTSAAPESTLAATSGTIEHVEHQELLAPTSHATIENRVRFMLADGYTMVGTSFSPVSGNGPFPAVLVLPMHIENRSAWDGFAQQMTEAGFAVLIVDLRGQGETGGRANWETAAEDVVAAWSQFTQDPSVDRSRTSILGASSGASVAMIAMQLEPDIRAAVLISPGEGYFGLQIRPALQATRNRPILVISGQYDTLTGDWPEQMVNIAGPHVTFRLFPSAQHGTYLFNNEPGISSLVIEWLKGQLYPAPEESNTDFARKLITGVTVFLACVGAIFLLLLGAALIVVRIRRSQARKGGPLVELLPPEAVPAVDARRSEVQGKIVSLINPPEASVMNETAVLRLLVERRDSEIGWVVEHDRIQMSPFILEDNDRNVQVIDASGGVQIKGQGVTPPVDQLPAVLQYLQLPESLSWQTDRRFILWQLNVGDEVTILGEYQDQQWFAAREVGWREQDSPLTAPSTLRPGQEQVTTRGQISLVDRQVDRQTQVPLAAVRLLVEEYDSEDGWVILGDIRRSCRAFYLKDLQGGVWVEMNPDHMLFHGPGQQLPDDQAEKALRFPGMPQLRRSGSYRVRVWQFRQGDMVTLHGRVTMKQSAVISASIIKISKPSASSAAADAR